MCFRINQLFTLINLCSMQTQFNLHSSRICTIMMNGLVFNVFPVTTLEVATEVLGLKGLNHSLGKEE